MNDGTEEERETEEDRQDIPAQIQSKENEILQVQHEETNEVITPVTVEEADKKLYDILIEFGKEKFGKV